MERVAYITSKLNMDRALPSHDIEFEDGSWGWAVNREVNELFVGDVVLVVPTSDMGGFYILKKL